MALADFDDDGWTDIYLANGHSHPNALYRNQGDGTFVDIAADVGVDSTQNDGAVLAGDVDNDGDTDLLVAGQCTVGTRGDDGNGLHDASLRVYRNEGGVFTEEPITVTSKDGSIEQGSACTVSLTWVDADEDGDLDILQSVGNDPDISPPWKFRLLEDPHLRDAVLVNDGTGHFNEVWLLVGHNATFASAAFDLDGDEGVEIVQGPTGYFVRWHGDRLIGWGDFRDTGLGLWMGLAVGDYNSDGALDVYSTNQGLSSLVLGYKDTDPKLTDEWINYSHALLLNDGAGTLARTEWAVDDQPAVLAGDLYTGWTGDEWLEPRDLARYAWGWPSVPIDADADGWTDVAWVGNACLPPMTIIGDETQGAGPGALLLNQQGTGWRDATLESGFVLTDEHGYAEGRGLAVGDLNNDGYADLVVNARGYNRDYYDPGNTVPGQPKVYLSKPRDGGWLKVKLHGTTSPADPVGATVHVTWPDGRVAAYPYFPGGATSSSSEAVVLVGLGDAEQVDLRVRFPSGIEVTLEDVDANQRIEVTE